MESFQRDSLLRKQSPRNPCMPAPGRSARAPEPALRAPSSPSDARPVPGTGCRAVRATSALIVAVNDSQLPSFDARISSADGSKSGACLTHDVGDRLRETVLRAPHDLDRERARKRECGFTLLRVQCIERGVGLGHGGLRPVGRFETRPERSRQYAGGARPLQPAYMCSRVSGRGRRPSGCGLAGQHLPQRHPAATERVGAARHVDAPDPVLSRPGG